MNYNKKTYAMDILDEVYTAGLDNNWKNFMNIAYNTMSDNVVMNNTPNVTKIVNMVKSYCDKRSSNCLKDEKQRLAMRKIYDTYKQYKTW